MGNHRLTVARAKFGKLSSSRKEKRSLVSVVASLLMLVERWRFSFLPPVHYPSKKRGRKKRIKSGDCENLLRISTNYVIPIHVCISYIIPLYLYIRMKSSVMIHGYESLTYFHD